MKRNQRNHRTVFAALAAALLTLALAACDTGPDYSEDITALRDEVSALQTELDTFRNDEWGAFNDQWTTFQEDWTVYREEIGLGE